MTMITSTLITVDEFAQRPKRMDGCREELVRGEIIVTPPIGYPHGVVQANIAFFLKLWSRGRSSGRPTTETGLRTETAPDTVRGPDVAFWDGERLPLHQGPQVYPEVPAELVVEILSPSNRRAEMDAKVNEYLAAGVRVVWVVDPLAYTVTVYHEPDAGELLDATAIIRDDVVLPGFSCRVGEFFE